MTWVFLPTCLFNFVSILMIRISPEPAQVAGHHARRGRASKVKSDRGAKEKGEKKKKKRKKKGELLLPVYLKIASTGKGM